VAAIFSDRLAQLSYQQARRLIVPTGLAVLAVVSVVMYARRVDSVEVAGTLLFAPIFLAFVFRGAIGGVVMAVIATAAYAGLRYPAIEAVGAGAFSGLIVSRAAAFLIFGTLGGWSTQVLEGSLNKLELYDEIDDETGLYNARFLLHQLDLEIARARRYKTLFSVVTLDVPSAPLQGLKPRQRRNVLRDLGRQLSAGVRTVDHVVHARDHALHCFVAILPETGAQGAEVFRGRFQDSVTNFLTGRGVDVSDIGAGRALAYPGDDEALDELRAEFTRIDAGQHRPGSVAV
jgi:GGDEF domain-containing protein